jgi:hypothetical protein
MFIIKGKNNYGIGNVKIKRPLIDCSSSIARVGTILKRVPKNHDCIISGFHFVNGKMMKQGTIKFVPKPEPGPTDFILSGNTIEYDDKCVQ